MTKQIFGILFLALALFTGCEREAIREQQDASLPVTNAAAIDLNALIARAKAGNKLVFLDFTGSDWCPPCIELHKEIFSQPEFQAYAESNLIFQVVDFPQKFRLPPEVMATNDLLAEKFNPEGFPTLIALDGDGKEIWRRLGFIEGGPKGLIAKLEAVKVKSK